MLYTFAGGINRPSTCCGTHRGWQQAVTAADTTRRPYLLKTFFHFLKLHHQLQLLDAFVGQHHQAVHALIDSIIKGTSSIQRVPGRGHKHGVRGFASDLSPSTSCKRDLAEGSVQPPSWRDEYWPSPYGEQKDNHPAPLTTPVIHRSVIPAQTSWREGRGHLLAARCLATLGCPGHTFRKATPVHTHGLLHQRAFTKHRLGSFSFYKSSF